MNNKYVYVQNIDFPNQKAHGVYIAKTLESVSNLGYQTNLIIPQRNAQNHLDINTYYQIDAKRFSVFKIKIPDLHSKPNFGNRFLPVLIYPLSAWLFALSSYKNLKKIKPNIIQTVEPELVLLLSLWPLSSKPKVILDFHIDPPIWLQKFILSKIDLVITNCSYFSKQLIHRGLSKNKVITLPNGYDPSQFQAMTKKHKDGKFSIGYIGRFETLGKEKGISELLSLFPELNKQVPGLEIIAIGGPETLVKRYRQLAKTLNLQEKIKIMSQVKPSQVGKFIQKFDLCWLVYPDTPHFRYKMSPMKAIEYAVARKPIIASDFPTLRELFEDDVYYVDPNNAQQIIETVAQIYKNQTEAMGKAKKLQKKLSKYSWENRQKIIFDKLQNL